eukprot:3943631-Pyramimonas_sp.AAC.1
MPKVAKTKTTSVILESRFGDSADVLEELVGESCKLYSVKKGKWTTNAMMSVSSKWFWCTMHVSSTARAGLEAFSQMLRKYQEYDPFAASEKHMQELRDGHLPSPTKPPLVVQLVSGRALDVYDQVCGLLNPMSSKDTWENPLNDIINE